MLDADILCLSPNKMLHKEIVCSNITKNFIRTHLTPFGGDKTLLSPKTKVYRCTWFWIWWVTHVLMISQWIHVHGKFTLQSNVWHFTESLFTSVLNCEIPFTSHPIPAILANLLISQSKSWKIRKIVIHGFHGFRKWWNVKSRSRSIHKNFNHDPSLVRRIDNWLVSRERNFQPRTKLNQLRFREVRIARRE